ncbi:MAG: hypothetical protein KH138_03715 [Firmicutes bacterium]|nr:hypothetical protein [Bacillota bacterium]
MEVKVVTVKRDVFIGGERIVEGTELMVSERNQGYYTIMRDCLSDNIKKKVEDGYPIVIHRSLVTEPEETKDVSFDGLLSILEVK